MRRDAVDAGHAMRHEAERQRRANRDRLAELEREADERHRRLRMVARLSYRQKLN
jgi:hypothetical protein